MNDGIKILLVEDSPSDIRLTEEALKRSDLKYELTIVNDGVEAMNYLNGAKSGGDKSIPDVILLDLNMPRKNGHEVLSDIKDDSSLSVIPVVLLTVSDKDEDIMAALHLKMNYYIAKPITSTKLSSIIKAIYAVNSEGAISDVHSKEEMYIRLVLAGNPHTTQTALMRLSEDPCERVRCRVAENEKAPAVLLDKLANDTSAEVRLSVSENPNVPMSLLEKLAKDPSEDVRLGISSNARTPAQLLHALIRDENIYVASSASKTLANLQS